MLYVLCILCVLCALCVLHVPCVLCVTCVLYMLCALCILYVLYVLYVLCGYMLCALCILYLMCVPCVLYGHYMYCMYYNNVLYVPYGYMLYDHLHMSVHTMHHYGKVILHSFSEDDRTLPKVSRLEEVLSKSLTEFLSISADYSITKVSDRTSQHLYKGPSKGELCYTY